MTDQNATPTPVYTDDTELDTTQGAAAAGRNRRTLVQWIKNGWLPAYQAPGSRGHYSFTYGDLKAAMKRKVIPRNVKEE